MNLPARVTLVDVGPRDGLQNESQPIAVDTRVTLVNMLADAGLPVVETGSFVNPKWVPQMASSEQVFAEISRRPGTRYAALTPNMKGFERALAAGADEVAVFAAASEAFSQKNINCSIEESLERFAPVMEAARSADIPVRGYVSCVIACPFDGDTAPTKVAGVTRRLLDELLVDIPADKLALHCHDTYGQALANILVGLQYGVATVDASVSGLGGCPYAPGATGNVATEDVVYMLEGMGIDTGVDYDKLRAAGDFISAALQRPNQSRAARALAAKKAQE